MDRLRELNTPTTARQAGDEHLPETLGSNKTEATTGTRTSLFVTLRPKNCVTALPPADVEDRIFHQMSLPTLVALSAVSPGLRVLVNEHIEQDNGPKGKRRQMIEAKLDHRINREDDRKIFQRQVAFAKAINNPCKKNSSGSQTNEVLAARKLIKKLRTFDSPNLCLPLPSIPKALWQELTHQLLQGKQWEMLTIQNENDSWFAKQAWKKLLGDVGATLKEFQTVTLDLTEAALQTNLQATLDFLDSHPGKCGLVIRQCHPYGSQFQSLLKKLGTCPLGALELAWAEMSTPDGGLAGANPLLALCAIPGLKSLSLSGFAFRAKNIIALAEALPAARTLETLSVIPEYTPNFYLTIDKETPSAILALSAVLAFQPCLHNLRAVVMSLRKKSEIRDHKAAPVCQIFPESVYELVTSSR